MNKAEYNAKYQEILERDGQIIPVNGAFSDLYPDLAFIEEQKVTDKGKITKLIGCHAWYRVKTDRELHNYATTLKGLFMTTLELVLKHKILIPMLWKWRWDVVHWAYRCYHKSLQGFKFVDTHLSPMGQEILRIGRELAKDIPLTLSNEPYEHELRYRVEELVKMFALFIETSSSYYTRTLDMLSNLNKGSCYELFRVLELCIQRDRDGADSSNHIKRAETILRGLKILTKKPEIKSLIERAIEIADLDKFKIDDDDKYFMYRKERYDTGGKSPEERKQWVDKVDKEKGNLILINNEMS